MEDPVGKLFFREWYFVDSGYHIVKYRLFCNDAALHTSKFIDKELHWQGTFVYCNIKCKGFIGFLVLDVCDMKFIAETFLKLFMMVYRTLWLLLLKL